MKSKFELAENSTEDKRLERYRDAEDECYGFINEFPDSKEVVTAEKLISYTRGVGKLPEKPVLITFDDGFYNNLSIALPLLEKHDMRAVVSIVGRYTDDYAAADPHADCYSYLTWADISELAASGRVEIGSHTYDMHSRSGLRQGCAKLPEESNDD